MVDRLAQKGADFGLHQPLALEPGRAVKLRYTADLESVRSFMSLLDPSVAN